MSLVLPTYDDVVRASATLKGVAHRTPIMTSTTADRATRAQLFFKCENLQRMGAFKFRGGYNAIANLSAEQRRAGVVTFSSGNHAQAIALAGKLLGVQTTIIMPIDAPVAKKAATREYGATVVEYDRYTQNRDDIARDPAVVEQMLLQRDAPLLVVGPHFNLTRPELDVQVGYALIQNIAG